MTKKTTGLDILKKSFSHYNNDGYDNGDRYSYRGSTSTSWAFEGITLGSEVTYPGVVNVGDVVFAVIVIYSTGDSFSRDYSGSYECVAVYKDVNKAKALVEIIKNSKGKNYATDLSYVEDDGTVHKLYCPWNGYFEKLESVVVYGFSIEERKK